MGKNCIRILTLLLPVACAFADNNPPVLPKNALPVPIVYQSNGYTCGPAALLSVLLYWQVTDDSESDLLEITGTTSDGAPPWGLVAGAKEYGLQAYYKEHVTIEQLKQVLATGRPVILDIQAWPEDPGAMPWSQRREDGHYVVLIALDNNYAYFMDPSMGTGYTYIPLAELEERWHDYEERTIWNNEHLAIFISGKKPMQGYPFRLSPTQ